MVIDSKTDTKATIHFAASASSVEKTPTITVDAPEAKKQVGPLGITRDKLSFTKDTVDHFRDDPIWKTIVKTGGGRQKAKIDIRHKVSIHDVIVHTDNTLNPKNVHDAFSILEAKQVPGKGSFKPEEKSRVGVIKAARRYLQAVNNDISNLFLGPMSENRSLKEKYDAGV